MADHTRRLTLAVCAWCVLAAASTTNVGPFLLPAAAQSSSPQIVSGKARVVDGDTLAIGSSRIRLYGVDAPESKQLCTDAAGKEYACGQVAAKQLAERVAAGGGTVKCTVKDRDQYGRLVASCAMPSAGSFAQDEEDMGDFMIRRGQAVAYAKITKQYVPAENAARGAKQGIWAGRFEPPAKWRYERRAEGADGGESSSASAAPSFSGSGGGGGAAAATGGVMTRSKTAAAKASPSSSFSSSTSSSSGCRIKGNISAKGERIYHVETDSTYATTKIDPSTGERYFCSEEEAVKAGWRPSRAPKTGAVGSFTNGARRRW